MQIKNPINSDIKVSIKGESYFLPANGTLSNVPEAHARQWQESLHKFLILKKDELEAVVKETIEITKPEVEVEKEILEDLGEVIEEKKEEVKEVKPKKVVAKKTNKKK